MTRRRLNSPRQLPVGISFASNLPDNRARALYLLKPFFFSRKHFSVKWIGTTSLCRKGASETEHCDMFDDGSEDCRAWQPRRGAVFARGSGRRRCSGRSWWRLPCAVLMEAACVVLGGPGESHVKFNAGDVPTKGEAQNPDLLVRKKK